MGERAEARKRASTACEIELVPARDTVVADLRKNEPLTQRASFHIPYVVDFATAVRVLTSRRMPPRQLHSVRGWRYRVLSAGLHVMGCQAG